MEVENGEPICTFEHIEDVIGEIDAKFFRETGRCPCDRNMGDLEFAELSTTHLDPCTRECVIEQMLSN
jgi:hypothetical protein